MRDFGDKLRGRKRRLCGIAQCFDRLCLKMGRELGDGEARTRVRGRATRGSGTWGREIGDAGYYIIFY